MIRRFRKEEETKIMTIWTKGNFKAHNFIDREYWIGKFNDVKEQYLYKGDTFVYIEDEEIKGFISLIDDECLGAIFVVEDSQREGIGRRLLNYCRERNHRLTLKVYDKNVDAMLFFTAMGFKRTKISIDDETGEQEIEMEWRG